MKWNFLDTFAAFLVHEKQTDLNPSASLEGIQRIEMALSEQERIRGFNFPPSYKAFLLRYDGGMVYDEDTSDFVLFFSVAEDEKNKCSLMDYNGSDTVLMDHCIETYFPFEALVVFAADGGSDFWAFDPRQQRADGEMPVRYCDHESGYIYAQAEDFPSFILAITKHEATYRELEGPL